MFSLQQFFKAGLILVSLFALWSCDRGPVYDSLQGQIFATTYYIRFQQPEQRLPLAPLQAEIDARLAELDQIFSSYKADSELNQFNRLPALQANTSASAPLNSAAMTADSGLAHRSKDFIALFRLSQQIFTASAGAFDPSIGPLVNLWGFGPELSIEHFQRQPSQQQIDAALQQLNFAKLILAGDEIIKPAAVSLDFSAVAKGYAVDQVLALLADKGVQHMMVEIGGELATRGLNAEAKPWRIGVEAPAELRQQTLSVLRLEAAQLATSGDYRNYFEHQGVRYSHTLDPRTGKPIRHRLASVTVLADSVAAADAWATALMVLGDEAGVALAQKLNLDALFVVRKQQQFELLQTGNMAQYLQSDMQAMR